MAKKNISWTKIEPGQIVTFKYKGKASAKSVNRTVLCINPNLRYRKKNGRVTKFFVGIQLDTAITRPMTSSKMTRLIMRLGGLENEEGAVSVEMKDTITKPETSKILTKVKSLSKFFRTFNLRECKRNRVFLESEYQKLPKNTVDLFEAETKTTKTMMELNED